MKIYFLIYFLVINIITYILFYIDKQRAIKHRYRISEKTLLLCILGFGFIGGYLSMKQNRHKTKKPLFYIALITSVVIFSGLVYFSISQGGFNVSLRK
ncbi:DUF1294 domain-containing protein [Mycoplasma sp. P36-A1]|uniref:DUF1294 domain-containing protein n=1 Tax=Mycoplasma sp. P36-A1 TaxID=3252900 RepID=UPI003C2FB243